MILVLGKKKLCIPGKSIAALFPSANLTRYMLIVPVLGTSDNFNGHRGTFCVYSSTVIVRPLSSMTASYTAASKSCKIKHDTDLGC